MWTSGTSREKEQRWGGGRRQKTVDVRAREREGARAKRCVGEGGRAEWAVGQGQGGFSERGKGRLSGLYASFELRAGKGASGPLFKNLGSSFHAF
jgi:hypothetical protein